MVKQKRLRVGITAGDPNGIGMEVALKALSDARLLEHITPVLYGTLAVVEQNLATMPGLGLNVKPVDSADVAAADTVSVLNVCDPNFVATWGAPNRAGGRYAFQSLQRAVADLASNKIDALVTAPISKEWIQSDEFQFPGHTEYLAAYANEDNPLMILCHEALRVALVTGHVSVSSLRSTLSSAKILQKIEAFHKSLCNDFGLNRPRIAVLGFNPHNGDNGLMGNEESEMIAPALAEARERGWLVFGPFAADGFFGSAQRSRFDGVLAMYHDQGLAPFKALAFEGGVNFTAGLPIVRTSPDHGTAFDIAGKNLASESSMREAIFAAADIYRCRQEQRQWQANPLVAQQKSTADR